MNYLFPLAFYLIIGGIMPQLNSETNETIIPAMMIFSVIVSTLLGMPNDIVNSRNEGVYRSFKINGVLKREVLLVPAISTLVHTFLVSCIVIVTAPLLFKVESSYSLLSLFITFLCVYLTCSGFALIIGSISDNTSVTILLAQLIFLPSMLIGGLMLPSSQLSETLKKIGELLPSTYAMDLVLALNHKEAANYSSLRSMILLLSTGVLSYLIAYYLFRFDSNDKSRLKIVAILAFLPFIIQIIFM